MQFKFLMGMARAPSPAAADLIVEFDFVERGHSCPRPFDFAVPVEALAFRPAIKMFTASGLQPRGFDFVVRGLSPAHLRPYL
jgi:hypothetical protein